MGFQQSEKENTLEINISNRNKLFKEMYMRDHLPTHVLKTVENDILRT